MSGVARRTRWLICVVAVGASCAPGGEPAAPEPPPSCCSGYTVAQGEGTVTVAFPTYLAKVQRGSPLGIVLLQLVSQPRDFAHPELPLGDWEWFALGQDAPRDDDHWAKLLQPVWPPPAVMEFTDSLRIVFRLDDVLQTGIALGLEYLLRSDATLSVTYDVTNGSSQALEQPYAMLGFPGFSYPPWVNEVRLGSQTRTPMAPFLNFRQETIASGSAEETLLETQADLTPPLGGLRSALVISSFGSRYVLETKYVPDGDVTSVSAAHVLKAGYMTSHLYAVIEEIPPGGNRRIRVDYLLHRE